MVELRVVEVAERLLVEVPEVVHVDVVLDEQLPVAAGVDQVVRDLGEQAGTEAAHRLGEGPQVRVQAGRGRVRVDEDHPLPHVERRREETPGVEVELRELLLALGNHLQRALEVVAPLVVDAVDRRTDVAPALEHHHAAVATQVVEGAQLALPAAHDDDRRVRDERRDVVAWLGKLVRRRHEGPRPPDQAFLFRPEPRVVEVGALWKLVGRWHRPHGSPCRFRGRDRIVSVASGLAVSRPLGF